MILFVQRFRGMSLSVGEEAEAGGEVACAGQGQRQH